MSAPHHDVSAAWDNASPLDGTLGETALRLRALNSPIPSALRFQADARHWISGRRFPAMVAAVREVDGELVALQLTFLSQRADKAPVDKARLNIGTLGSGAVQLAEPGSVLGLAEGVETALAAMELHHIPVWATLGSERLGKIVLPDTVEEVVLCLDHDPAGSDAGDRAARVYRAQGRRVRLIRPLVVGYDWNDVLIERARRAA